MSGKWKYFAALLFLIGVNLLMWPIEHERSYLTADDPGTPFNIIITNVVFIVFAAGFWVAYREGRR